MRAVVQRVKRASVSIGGEIVGSIGKGLLVLLGIGRDDGEDDIEYILQKTVGLRVFEDENGKMNLSLEQASGDLLVVSQFTLYGDCRKGRRPSFTDAADPGKAEKYYELFCRKAAALGIKVERGRFAAMMDVDLLNDGPVTILLDSSRIL